MHPSIPEAHKQEGVCYVVADDGTELPVIDCTSAVFACRYSPSELAAIAETTIRSLERAYRLPRLLQRFIARRSVLMRNTRAAEGTFVSGMATYLLKLPPELLGQGYATGIDRRIAASLSPVALRLRLMETAWLLATHLLVALRTGPVCPLHLINIAGGTAIDSINALVLAHREHPELLRDVPVEVHIMDIDSPAAHFGIRAVDMLRSSGGPLEGLQIAVRHSFYDWRDIVPLRDALRRIGREDVQVFCSSEGGLFEYGTDEEIVANLRVLHALTPSQCHVVGTAMKDDPIPARIQVMSRTQLRLFSKTQLHAVVEEAGWSFARFRTDNPLYHVFSLNKRSWQTDDL